MATSKMVPAANEIRMSQKRVSAPLSKMRMLAIKGAIVRLICIRVAPAVASSVEAPHLQWHGVV
jgi:hypothetical protein